MVQSVLLCFLNNTGYKAIRKPNEKPAILYLNDRDMTSMLDVICGMFYKALEDYVVNWYEGKYGIAEIESFGKYPCLCQNFVSEINKHLSILFKDEKLELFNTLANIIKKLKESKTG